MELIKIKYTKAHWTRDMESTQRVSVSVFEGRDTVTVSVVSGLGHLQADLSSAEMRSLAETCLAAANAAEGES